MSNPFTGRLGSLRLTLWLLLALAAVAAVGTFEPIPQGLEKARYDDLYGAFGNILTGLGLDRFHTSIPFRALFLALIVNLLFCALGRSRKGVDNMFARGEPAVTLPFADRQGALTALRASGFRILSENPLRAARRPVVFLSFALVHLAPVMIAAGAFWGSQGGFIATSNVYVDAIESKFLDWGRMEENHLPFAVKVESLKRQYHPLSLKLDLRAVGGALGEVVVKEGERFAATGSGFELVVDRFDPDAEDIFFRVFSPSGLVGSFTRTTMRSSPILVQPLAFKGEERQVSAGLSFFDQAGRLIGSGEASVNNPVSVLGHRVFLTSWGEEEGKPFVGLQVTRDPGQFLVWTGSVIFTLGLFLLLFAEGAWVREETGGLAARSTRGRRGLHGLLGDGGGDAR